MLHRRYSIRIVPAVESLAGIKRFVSRVAQLHNLPHRIRDDVALAVYEGCANVVEHADADGPGHTLLVEMELEPDAVTVYIYDSGTPFTPPSPRRDIWGMIDNGSDGGLGLWMIHSMMDEVEFSRQGDRNILRMRKHLTQIAPAGH